MYPWALFSPYPNPKQTAILEWLAKSPTSPVTRTPLQESQLATNRDLIPGIQTIEQDTSHAQVLPICLDTKAVGRIQLQLHSVQLQEQRFFLCHFFHYDRASE